MAKVEYKSPYFSEDDIGAILAAHRRKHNYEDVILPRSGIIQGLLTQLYQQTPKPAGSVSIMEAAKPFKRLVEPNMENCPGIKWRRALFGNDGESNPGSADFSEELTPILRQ